MASEPDAPPKNKGGKPPKYRAEFPEQAAKLCVLGATDQELGDFFEVTIKTIYEWKHTHPEFCAALKAGKEVADERVIRSLYQRAITSSDTAAIFWLKNRCGWRDKTEHEHAGPGGQPIQNTYRIEFVSAIARPEDQPKAIAAPTETETD